jgi:amidase
MKHRHTAFVNWLPLAFLSMGACMGCTSLHKHSSTGTSDHAYIVYWPPPQGSRQLRLAVKDTIDMKGVVTTAGSEYRAKHSLPAARDADCLKLARQRHVWIVGKTNLSEFGLTSSGMNDYFGTPVNPLGRNLMPGGSASGSAVAIANGTADVAFGSDTCGSIRVPAACCGIAALKTTFGLVSTRGVFPISPIYLDTVGPMAKDVAHLVQGMDLLQEGFAGRYRAAVAAKPSAKDIKVGRVYIDGTDPAIDRAVDDALAAAGFQVIKLGREFQAKWERAEKDGQTVAHADAWANDRAYDFKWGVESKTSAFIVTGKLLSGKSYRAALRERAQSQIELLQAFKYIDFIALPTLQTVPHKLPPLTRIFGGSLFLELRLLGVQNTDPMNLVGNPALVLPIPLQGRSVPVASLQLAGPLLSEAELLNAGRLVESRGK